ncbi:MAG: hypothetical protein ACYS1A_05790, partial [Planctomycetota bacterium]
IIRVTSFSSACLCFGKCESDFFIGGHYGLLRPDSKEKSTHNRTFKANSVSTFTLFELVVVIATCGVERVAPYHNKRV